MRLFQQKLHPPAQKTMIEVRHDGETYQIRLRRVDNARRFILRVRNATQDVVLTMPRRAAVKDAADFAARNAAWVGARLRRLPERAPFIDGATFPLRGVHTKIVNKPDMRGVAAVDTCEDRESGAQQTLSISGAPLFVERRVQDWLKAQCRRDLADAVSHYAALAERPTPSFSVRDTTSRWGSCSSAGALNFSWRLILAPPDVLRYLTAHEVCHLVHMNHSPKFWSLCRAICPETDRAEIWLKAHGADLHRYGAKAGPLNAR